MRRMKMRLAIIKLFQIALVIAVMVLWMNFVTFLIGVYCLMYAVATWAEKHQEVQEEQLRFRLRWAGRVATLRR